MTTDPTIMLKRLEPAVRPAYAGGPGPGPAAPLERRPFDELLAQAARGQLESGRPVSAADAAGALTGAELARLSAAADAAEAAGATRALLLMDGRGLVLDVATRSLGAELSADAASRVIGVDAAVFVTGGEARSAPALEPPGGVAPPAVGRQLDAADQGQPAAA